MLIIHLHSVQRRHALFCIFVVLVRCPRAHSLTPDSRHDGNLSAAVFTNTTSQSSWFISLVKLSLSWFCFLVLVILPIYSNSQCPVFPSDCRFLSCLALVVCVLRPVFVFRLNSLICVLFPTVAFLFTLKLFVSALFVEARPVGCSGVLSLISVHHFPMG